MDMVCDGFGDQGDMSPGRLQAYAARSLDLLAAIEETLIALDTESTVLRAYAQDASRLFNKLRGASLGRQLDPDRIISGTFSKAAATAARLHDSAAKARSSAQHDSCLTPDDGVVDAYDQYLAAVVGYHDALEDLREFIETHDALLSTVHDKSYSDAESLFADIVAGR